MDVDGDPGCLDYIWLRGPITVESCRLAFDRPGGRRPDALPVGPLRARAPGSGSVAERGRSAWPIAATGATRRRTRSRRCTRRSRSRAATASSSTSGPPSTASRCCSTTRTSRACRRSRVTCATLTAEELAGHGIPTLGEVLDAVGCDAVPRRRAEGARRRRDRRCSSWSAAASTTTVGPSCAARSSRRSTPRSSRWLAAERPTWPRWLNAYDLSPATIDSRRRPRLRGDLRRVARDRRGVRRARARRRPRRQRLDRPGPGGLRATRRRSG